MNLEEEILRKLRYDRESGYLFWKEIKNPSTKNEKIYNGRFSNKKTGWLNSRGYLKINIYKKSLLGHRIIWFLEYGSWPSKDLDHIDGNPSNNKLDNLREVTKSENLRNCKRRQDNTSGITGVHYNKRQNQWTACVVLKGKKKHLGTFETKEEAINARDLANKDNKFHNNHGRQSH